MVALYDVCSSKGKLLDTVTLVCGWILFRYNSLWIHNDSAGVSEVTLQSNSQLVLFLSLS